jgi:uncharacterized protein YciI
MTRKEIVKGYLMQSREHRIETLYAVTQSGRVWTSGPHKTPNDTFHVPGATWVRVAQLPKEAEFCGHYDEAKMPAYVRLEEG